MEIPFPSFLLQTRQISIRRFGYFTITIRYRWLVNKFICVFFLVEIFQTVNFKSLRIVISVMMDFYWIITGNGRAEWVVDLNNLLRKILNWLMGKVRGSKSSSSKLMFDN